MNDGSNIRVAIARGAAEERMRVVGVLRGFASRSEEKIAARRVPDNAVSAVAAAMPELSTTQHEQIVMMMLGGLVEAMRAMASVIEGKVCDG